MNRPGGGMDARESQPVITGQLPGNVRKRNAVHTVDESKLGAVRSTGWLATPVAPRSSGSIPWTEPLPETSQLMRLGARVCMQLTAIVISAVALSAQSVRGLGDDALTAPRGSIRIQFSTAISDFSQRYSKGSPGRADGSLEPLFADFSVDTLGVRQFPGLTPVQNAIRALTGNSAFTLSLGRTVLTSSVRVQTTPIALEAGLTNRLSLGVMVPIVSARHQVQFNVNPGTSGGTVSFNPGRGVDAAAAARNALLVSQLTTARTQLASLLAACVANPASSATCPAVIANGAALTTNAQSFTDGIIAVYGTRRTDGSLFVPIAGSAADSAIVNRVTALRTQFQQYGITALAATTTGPASPSAAITPDGLQSVIQDSLPGLLAARLGTITRQGLGDIEVAVKLRLFDSFGARSDTMRFLPRGLNIRQSFAGAYRFGTGTIDQADDFLDVGTGDGQNDIEVRSFTDVVYGRKFFASVIARYTVQLADQQLRRITDRPDEVFAPSYRERLVSRDLGDQLELEFTPRWILSDFFSVGAQYLIRRKAEDTFTGTFTVPPTESGLAAPLSLDASTLRLETAVTEQRVGFGLTFSSLASHSRGKASLPIEVQYFNSRTISGSGGAVPRLSIHQLQVRLYPRR